MCAFEMIWMNPKPEAPLGNVFYVINLATGILIVLLTSLREALAGHEATVDVEGDEGEEERCSL